MSIQARRAEERIVEGAANRESDKVHAEHERPRIREDCRDGVRPCPWAGCRHHNALDVSPDTGKIKLAFPDREVWEIPETCSLDVAERGGLTLEDVGKLLNITRERTRQIEKVGLRMLRRVRKLKPTP